MTNRSRRKIRITLIYVLMLINLVLTLFPLLYAIGSSLRSDAEIFQYAMPFSIKTFIPVKATFDAYISIFTEYQFWKPILNTFIVSIIAIFGGCVINAIAAFAFTQYDFKFKKPLYLLVLFSFMIPFESITIPLYSIVDELGWINKFAGIVVPSLADGMVLFLFTQFFSEFPKSLFEAAKIDGANWFKQFYKILLPLSIPVFVTAGLMIFMTHWNSYLWPLLIARSPDMRLIQVALSDFRGSHTTEWAKLYAASTISAIIPLLFFFPFQKEFVQGITSTGVKG